MRSLQSSPPRDIARPTARRRSFPSPCNGSASVPGSKWPSSVPAGTTIPASSATEMATRLNIPVKWLYIQIRQKRLLMDRQPSGAYLFENTPSVIDGIRNLRNHAVNHLDLRMCQPHKEGHQHA